MRTALGAIVWGLAYFLPAYLLLAGVLFLTGNARPLLLGLGLLAAFLLAFYLRYVVRLGRRKGRT